MTTTLTVAPKADLAGDWELTPPLPVDGSVFTLPGLLGFDTAGYDGGDSAAPATATPLFLPTLPVQIGEIELVGEDHVVFNDPATYSATHNAPIPTVSGGILANDHIEIVISQQENPVPGAATSVAGFALLAGTDTAPPTAWIPRMELFYKKAVGGESGNVVVTIPSAKRLSIRTRVWRNVDPDDPYGSVTPSNDYGYGNPIPTAVTTADDNAVVVVTVAGNKAGGLTPATISAGYTLMDDTSDEDRSWVDCYKKVPTAGVETPSSWTWAPDQWGVIVTALKPAETTTVKMALCTSVADETATTALTSGVELPAINATQLIQQNATSGTFSLTYAGQTTAAIAYDATAAAVESALEALSNIGSGDVTCTGGPLDDSAVQVEFTGALAATDVSLLVEASGDVSITETQRGRAQEQFTKRTDFNIPRSGGDYEPQMHLWELDPVDYTAGDPVFITVSSHGTNHSWAAILLVFDKTSDTSWLETLGTETSGDDVSQGEWGTITPATEGSRVLGFFAKSSDGTQYVVPAGPSTPSRYSVIEALADGTTLSAFLSPPIGSRAEKPSPVSWSGSEDFATGLVSVKPEVAAGGGSLFSKVSTVDETTWLELAGSAGKMYEVLEFDLMSLPTAAVITAASISFAHSSNVSSALRIALCGINDDDTIVLAQEHQLGYRPSSTSTVETVETAQWTELEDASALWTFDRLGVVLFSTSAAAGIEEHKLYWVNALLEYEEGGPVVSNVAGPTNPGDPITWEYSSDSGLVSTAYQLMVVYGSAQDPDAAVVADNPMDPATGEIVYDSGKVFDSVARSLTISDAPLARDTCTFAVRAWARLPTGDEIVSDWSTDSVDISGSAPSAPAQSTNPSWTPTTGGVQLTVATPASVSRAWILRSVDSGSTWTVATEIGPTTVTPSSSAVIVDYFAPLAINSLRWQVVFDDGPMEETSTPVRVGGDFDTFTGTEGWYLMAPDNPALNMVLAPISEGPDVVQVGESRPRRSTVSEQEDAAIVATTLPLATRLEISVRTLNKADREELTALLESGLRLRLVNILGREWYVQVVGEVSTSLMQIQPLTSELTQLRDAHVTRFSAIQVQDV